MSTRPRGVCPACRGEWALTLNGCLRSHRLPLGGGLCPGSGGWACTCDEPYDDRWCPAHGLFSDDPCPVCGEVGACAVDDYGPLVHARPRDEGGKP